jgi:hypothetical protein
MAQIYASVEHVTLTITDAGGSASANLTKGQDETKCVPFYSVRVVADVDDQHNDRLPRVYFDDNAGTARVNAELPYGTDADDVVVEIFVVEFDSAYVKVQQVDYSAFTGASLTPTFTSVSAQSAAFILNSYVWDPDGQTSLDDFNDVAVQCRFDGASTSQALLSRRASGGTINGTLYVVEALDGEFSVQHSEIDVTTATDYSGTATVSSVTGSTTFLVHSYESSENADDMRDAAWIADLQDSTTVRVRRSTVLTPSATATHSVATVTCGASEWDVQRGEVDVTATSTTESITAIDQSRTCIVTQSGGTSGASSASTGRTLYTVGGIIDDAMTAVDFSANDTLRFQRFSVATATTTLVGYEVVQFSDGAVTHNLTADDVESASEVSTPTLGQAHSLTALDAESASEVSTPVLGQVHALIALGVESTSEVNTPSVGQIHSLIANDVEASSEVSSPTLSEVDTVDELIANNVEASSEVSTPPLGQIHALTATDVESASEVSSPVLAIHIPSVSCSLVDRYGNPLPSLSDLSWAWFDQTDPGSFLAPTDQGEVEETDVSGTFDIELPNSLLFTGDSGTLVMRSDDGSLMGAYTMEVA